MTQAFRVTYTITSADLVAAYAEIPYTLPVPYADTNYTTVAGIVLTTGLHGEAYGMDAIDTLTNSSGIAHVFVGESIGAQAGDVITVNLVTYHD